MIEHFSGPHDFMDMVTQQYLEDGTGTSPFGQSWAAWGVAMGMVPVATPFALASMTAGRPATAIIGLSDYQRSR